MTVVDKLLSQPLISDQIRLRPLQVADIETLRNWRNRDDTRRWFKHSALITAEQQASWFARYQMLADDCVFMVERASAPGVVGTVSAYRIDLVQREAEIGRFMVAPEYAGQGYMKAAIQALIEVGLRPLGIERVRLEVLRDNVRAIGLYTTCGFEAMVTDVEDVVCMHMLKTLK